jgi:hypothetical protein
VLRKLLKDFLFPGVFSSLVCAFFWSLRRRLVCVKDLGWVGRLEFMKTWSRERQRVGSCREGSKDDWVGSRARLQDVG